MDYVSTLVQSAVESAKGKGAKPSVADFLFLIRKVHVLASSFLMCCLVCR